MAYIVASLVGKPFLAISAHLRDDVAAAEPRLRALTEQEVSTPRGVGKWSRNQILGHLIDSAGNNHQRFVRAQAVAPLEDPGYAQEQWVASQRHGERPWRELVDFWCAYNRHLVHVLSAIPESCRDVPVLVADDAPTTLSFVARDYVGHIQHHLGQILA